MLGAAARRTRPPRNVRWITDGRVFCPLALADQDMERCLGCPWLKDGGTSELGPWIRCAPPPEVAMPRFSTVMSAGRESD